MFGMFDFVFSVRNAIEQIGEVLRLHKRRLDAHSDSFKSVLECLKSINEHLDYIDRYLGLTERGVQ